MENSFRASNPSAEASQGYGLSLDELSGANDAETDASNGDAALLGLQLTTKDVTVQHINHLEGALTRKQAEIDNELLPLVTSLKQEVADLMRLRALALLSDAKQAAAVAEENLLHR